MSIASKFVFIGEPALGNDPERFFRDVDGKRPAMINFAIKETERNRMFVESMGYKNDTFKYVDQDKNLKEVDWEDRNSPEVLNELPFYRKYNVNLGDEFGGHQTFATTYDMIVYLADNLPNFKGKVQVSGNWTKRPYNGKFINRYEISSVYAVKESDTSKLTATIDLFYNTDAVDKSSFKTDGKVYVNGYVEQYLSKDEGRAYIPQMVILNSNAYDMTNEKHKATWEYRLRYLTSELPKKAKMGHIQWECRLINGAEEVPFDETMLTDKQKEQIELGISTLEDFRPRGSVYGEKITEVRLVKPVLKGDYADGIVECDETDEEFQAKVYSFEKAETLLEVMKKAEAEDILTTAKVEEDTEEDDDLF